MHAASIGMGTLGAAVHRLLEDHADLVTYDVAATAVVAANRGHRGDDQAGGAGGAAGIASLRGA